MSSAGEQTTTAGGQRRRPLVVLLGGPNGAGKTTAARTVLAETLQLVNFVNADTIAQGLSGFAPADAAWDAGRIMLSRVDELAAQRADFAFESTLAGRSYLARLDRWIEFGYRVQICFVWLSSVELAIERVRQRVSEGGHAVPEEVIRSRYCQSVRNFKDLFSPRADEWIVMDNSFNHHCVEIAAGRHSEIVRIPQPENWRRFLRQVER